MAILIRYIRRSNNEALCKPNCFFQSLPYCCWQVAPPPSATCPRSRRKMKRACGCAKNSMPASSHRCRQGLPDGKYRWPPGGDRQVVIKNGRPLQLEIFHPNGRVRTRHSYNAQGEIEGWSHGYLSDGTLRLRLLYRNGTVTRLQAYNRAGRLEKDEIIDCAARTRTPVAVRPSSAKP